MISIKTPLGTVIKDIQVITDEKPTSYINDCATQIIMLDDKKSKFIIYEDELVISGNLLNTIEINDNGSLLSFSIPLLKLTCESSVNTLSDNVSLQLDKDTDECTFIFNTGGSFRLIPESCINKNEQETKVTYVEALYTVHEYVENKYSYDGCKRKKGVSSLTKIIHDKERIPFLYTTRDSSISEYDDYIYEHRLEGIKIVYSCKFSDNRSVTITEAYSIYDLLDTTYYKKFGEIKGNEIYLNIGKLVFENSNQTYKDKYIELDLSIFNGGEKMFKVVTKLGTYTFVKTNINNMNIEFNVDGIDPYDELIEIVEYEQESALKIDNTKFDDCKFIENNETLFLNKNILMMSQNDDGIVHIDGSEMEYIIDDECILVVNYHPTKGIWLFSPNKENSKLTEIVLDIFDTQLVGPWNKGEVDNYTEVSTMIDEDGNEVVFDTRTLSSDIYEELDNMFKKATLIDKYTINKKNGTKISKSITDKPWYITFGADVDTDQYRIEDIESFEFIINLRRYNDVDWIDITKEYDVEYQDEIIPITLNFRLSNFNLLDNNIIEMGKNNFIRFAKSKSKSNLYKMIIPII